MDEYSLLDFENVLCLKNQLALVPIETLLDVYSDSENFILFIDSVHVLIETDSAFLLFNEKMCEKISTIISAKRFEFKDKDVVNVINFIIKHLNTIHDYDSSYKNLLKNGYLAYQEECRKVEMEDTEVFLESMAHDAVVYSVLKEGNLEKIECDEFFLASVNYIIATMPEFFDDRNVCERLCKKFDEASYKKGFFRNRKLRLFAKETKERFVKIKKA